MEERRLIKKEHSSQSNEYKSINKKGSIVKQKKNDSDRKVKAKRIYKILKSCSRKLMIVVKDQVQNLGS